ncbi:MAG TPA: tripartite tricarboxylate transporter substrate binding protein [Burkholderiales bacterium]|nr:tripartite tricarboxylate transporter substrate binding protein [Burkholderiales bacterium]
MIRWWSVWAGVLCMIQALPPVPAQDYPVRSVRMVLPFPAGGGSDLIARVTAQKLSSQLGQQVVVDNRAGASGNIAAEIVAKSPPDGYTVLFGNSSLAIVSAVYQKLAFDPVRDFLPISMASSYPFMLVAHPSLPVRNVKELAALAKLKPGALTYASAGSGTMAQFAMELFSIKTGARLTHLPYKGAAPASIGILTGEAQCGFLVMPVAQVQIRAGKLRGLGVASARRSPVMPEIPTMIEAGVADHIALQWNGLFVPAKTPPALADRLHKEMVKALASAEVKQRFEAEGAEPVGSSPAEFAAFFRAESAKWADVARRSGTKLD